MKDVLFANYVDRVDDDEKLREKVNEAMAVYDEYVKNAEAPTENGESKPEDANAGAEAESVAA